MKRSVAVALFLLAACKDKPGEKPEPRASEVDANAPVPQDRLPYTPYRFGNFNDPLGRFWFVAPVTFARTETKSCTATDCLAEIALTGDDITIRGYALPAAEERHSLEDEKKAAAAAKKTLSGEKQPGGKRGYSFWVTSSDGATVTWTEQLPTFVQPIRIELTGPASKRALLEDMSVRIATVFDVAMSPPEKYCRPLPWSPPAGRKDHPQTWIGKLGPGKGGASYVLTLDQAVCDPFSRAIWELEVTGKDLAPFAGKHVKAEGSFDPPGSGSMRPIVSALTKVEEAP